MSERIDICGRADGLRCHVLLKELLLQGHSVQGVSLYVLRLKACNAWKLGMS